jgi:hypothetical protein
MSISTSGYSTGTALPSLYHWSPMQEFGALHQSFFFSCELISPNLSIVMQHFSQMYSDNLTTHGWIFSNIRPCLDVVGFTLNPCVLVWIGVEFSSSSTPIHLNTCGLV